MRNKRFSSDCSPDHGSSDRLRIQGEELPRDVVDTFGWHSPDQLQASALPGVDHDTKRHRVPQSNERLAGSARSVSIRQTVQSDPRSTLTNRLSRFARLLVDGVSLGSLTTEFECCRATLASVLERDLDDISSWGILVDRDGPT